MENGKKFFEKIQENVFARAIDEARKEGREIQFYFNHDNKKVLGQTGENVELLEDAVGLRIKAIIKKENPHFQEILNNVNCNRLQGFSFGFIPLKQNWEDDKHVTVQEMRLLEVSLLNVTPAYNGTVVETRDKDGEQVHLRYAENGGDNVEELLKELIAEVKSLKEAILEDKEAKEEKKEEVKEDKPVEEVKEPVKEEEVKEEEKPVEEEPKEEPKDEPKEEDKEEDKTKEEEDKKRALEQLALLK